ncbi:DUF2716 domain-containing protein [Nonomuraea sp. NPDC050536]|uniref:DUF2716 domain-containing protein n=1 Tax=Nonomuraea sp. NPDC050536 TaxID=3364366 RepID=UPI0037CB3D96
MVHQRLSHRPDPRRWAGTALVEKLRLLADEHVIQVTEDLRMGTFGNWREASLCVFGEELLAHVDEELTKLLGTVLRRGGRPVAARITSPLIGSWSVS